MLDFESVPAATTDMTLGNPYAAQGISFSKNAWSMASKIAQSNPGDGNFFRGLDANNKSLTRGALHLALNPDAPPTQADQAFVINVAEGFDTDFSLLYAASISGKGQISIFSNADGLGDVLGSVDLIEGAQCVIRPGWLCNWTPAGVQFSGVAHSIRISGNDGQFLFDDIRLQLNQGGNPVPEPGGMALSLAALGALAWSRKRRVR
ncbi:PEP-CTERM sorting domain-containing protein [Paucibacter sp. Y2R2-4]|uniref:PEP-CTERM sorting domain-containing protein n=1 Tax=Paucibacter sp. Y2R2-4 TaxID=2893553 RepID=UPI0021E43704|nr:PEP-CTERM sorting domain-containing protein [Paucibacter sp. Y2R2-4]MCV2349970.1 PEP-CTERM sorting domain-containing protein [Paucibacter sp. Y2R2-4]